MDVLIRAKVNDDGLTVSMAPGVELPVRAVDIATDVPPTPDGMPLACIMFFETEQDREEFAELFTGEPGVHAREL